MTLEYWKKISVPLVAVGLYLLSTILIPRQVLYTKLALFVVILVWYRWYFSFRELISSYRYGREFWLPYLVGLGGLLGCYFIREALSNTVFSGLDTGMIQVWYRGTAQTILLYAIRLILEPVAIELFFRGAVIVREDRRLMIATALLGTLLASLLSYTGWVGIVETMISALPLVLVYCWTGDIYTNILLHLTYAFVVNIPEIIYEAMRQALA